MRCQIHLNKAGKKCYVTPPSLHGPQGFLCPCRLFPWSPLLGCCQGSVTPCTWGVWAPNDMPVGMPQMWQGCHAALATIPFLPRASWVLFPPSLSSGRRNAEHQPCPGTGAERCPAPRDHVEADEQTVAAGPLVGDPRCSVCWQLTGIATSPASQTQPLL